MCNISFTLSSFAISTNFNAVIAIYYSVKFFKTLSTFSSPFIPFYFIISCISILNIPFIALYISFIILSDRLFYLPPLVGSAKTLTIAQNQLRTFLILFLSNAPSLII